MAVILYIKMNMNMKRLVFTLWLFSLCVLRTQAADSTAYPEIGKPCPTFVLRNIEYYSRKEARLSDFRGKWLVLDFWNKECGACVASFPGTSRLQQQFGDKVQFMLVGIEDLQGEIRPMYAEFRKKENLLLPCAFDSSIANQFDIYTAPFIIVIDPEGIVQALTYALNSYDIEGFLSGHPPHLKRVFRMNEDEVISTIPYDRERPFLVKGNGGLDTDFIFRSVLSRYDPTVNAQFVPEGIDSEATRTGRFEVLGAPLYRLYNYAYYGAVNPGEGFQISPLLKTKDSALFRYFSADGRNMFSYSLSIPAGQSGREKLQAIMQKDLENYFGLAVKRAVIKVPVWKLVAKPGAEKLLRTKGGARSYGGVPKINMVVKNFPFRHVIKNLQIFSGIAFTNATGIDYNVDMSIDLLFNGDVVAMKKALAPYGLDLQEEWKELKVLQISDKMEKE